MAYVWKEPGFKSVGNADGSISPYLKAWIKRGNNICCGVIGDGSTLDLQSNWDTPFEGASFGSYFEQIGGLIQLKSETTSRTMLNSAQVWGGNRPISVNLSLELYALNDAVKEVEDALTMLKEFASPELNSSIPVGNITSSSEASLGRIPDKVMVNMGRNFIYEQCVITSVSEPFDVTRDSNGNRLTATVNISIETDTMVNKSDIARLTTG